VKGKSGKVIMPGPDNKVLVRSGAFIDHVHNIGFPVHYMNQIPAGLLAKGDSCFYSFGPFVRFLFCD